VDRQNDSGDVAARLRAVLERTPGVRFCVLFGSSADGTRREDSDFDVAVQFETDVALSTELDLQAALTLAVGLPADLVRLDTASTVLRWEVARKGQFLCGDPRAFARFRAAAAAEYIDFAPALAVARERFRRRLAQGARKQP
jgi:predicted nucleotidyltransferase